MDITRPESSNQLGGAASWKIEKTKNKDGKEVSRLKASSHEALGKGIKVKAELSRFEQTSDAVLKKFRGHKWVKVKVTIQEGQEGEPETSGEKTVYVNIKSLSKQAFFRSQGIRDAEKPEEIKKFMEGALSLDKDIIGAQYLNPTATPSQLDKLDDKTGKERKLIRNYLGQMRKIKQDAKEKGSYVEITTAEHTFTVWETGEMYLHGEILGEGSYKTAIIALDIFQGKEIALLKLRPSLSPNRVPAAEKEIKNLLLFQGKSPYIVQLQKVSWETSEKLEQKMVLELCNGGELFNWIEGNSNKSLTELQKMTVAQHIIRGVRDIHKEGCIHSDLKPENIFLTIDPTNASLISAKVGDLGTLHPAGELQDNGTLNYMSPNHLVAYQTQWTNLKEKYTRTEEQKFKDETYELGLVLFLLFFPEEPLEVQEKIFVLNEQLEILGKNPPENIIEKAVTSIKDEVASKINALKESTEFSAEDQMQLMILRMLQFDSSDQPSLEEVDQFFTGLIDQPPSENLPEGGK